MYFFILKCYPISVALQNGNCLVIKGPVNRTEESLVEFVKGYKEEVATSIREKLGPGEVVEYILAKGIIPIGPKQFQGGEARINKMGIVEKFRIRDRIIGRRKITFSQTVGGGHITFKVRTLLLRAI